MDILAEKPIVFCMDAFLPMPRPTFLWFSEPRERFLLPVARSREWVLLGLRSGRFRFALGEAPWEVCGPGELVICPPGVDLHRESLERMVFYCASFRWKPTDAALWRGLKSPGDLVRLDSTLAYLRALAGSLADAREAAWAGHLLADLLYLCRREERTRGEIPAEAPDRLMLEAAEWIRAHLAGPGKLEELARRLHLSAFALSRRFRAAWGVPPAIFRTRLRVEEARRLLLETPWTVERVAERCGFENAFYFSRVFSRQAGMAPRDFRRAHRV